MLAAHIFGGKAVKHKTAITHAGRGALIALLCAGAVSTAALAQERAVYGLGHANPSGTPPPNNGGGGKPPTIVLKQTGVTVDRLGQDELAIWGLENEVKTLKQLVSSQQAQMSGQQAKLSNLSNQLSSTQGALNALQTKFAKHAHKYFIGVVLTPAGPRTDDNWYPTTAPIQPNQNGIYAAKRRR
jgi:hypothetical protein